MDAASAGSVAAAVGPHGFGGGQADTAVIDLLKGATTKWAAAQSGAMQAAGLALDSGSTGARDRRFQRQ